MRFLTWQPLWAPVDRPSGSPPPKKRRTTKKTPNVTPWHETVDQALTGRLRIPGVDDAAIIAQALDGTEAGPHNPTRGLD
jgi:hypothetical protein